MLTQDHDNPTGETALESQKWYTVPEAARWLDLTVERVGKLVNEGKIDARRFDGEHMIRRETLRDLMPET